MQRGTTSNRNREGHVRFCGLNVVYDVEGHEYPVYNDGIIHIPTGEQTGAAAEKEQPQQGN